MNGERPAPYPNNLVEGLPNGGFPLKSVASLMIAGAVAIPVIGKELSGDSGFLPRYALAYFTEDSCELLVDGDLLRRTERVLDRPDTPVARAIYQAREDFVTGDDEFYSQRMDLALISAGEYGLNVVDYRSFEEAISSSNSVNEALEAVNNYTALHGFSVVVPQSKSLKDWYIVEDTVDFAELDIERFKEGSLRLIRHLSTIPTELSAVSNFKELRLVKDFKYNNPDPGSGSRKAFAGSLNDAIHFRMDTYYSLPGSLFDHELWHKIDFKICGAFGSRRDGEYTSLNTRDFEYGDGENRNVVGLNVVDSYAGTNTIEDKASLMENSLAGFNPNVASSGLITLRRKYILLLARLEMQVPGILEYFDAISIKTAVERTAQPNVNIGGFMVAWTKLANKFGS